MKMNFPTTFVSFGLRPNNSFFRVSFYRLLLTFCFPSNAGFPEIFLRTFHSSFEYLFDLFLFLLLLLPRIIFSSLRWPVKFFTAFGRKFRRNSILGSNKSGTPISVSLRLRAIKFIFKGELKMPFLYRLICLVDRLRRRIIEYQTFIAFGIFRSHRRKLFSW